MRLFYIIELDLVDLFLHAMDDEDFEEMNDVLSENNIVKPNE